MISVRNVSKTFGRVEAVRGVSLDIGAGEFFSILGASGSGKTTVLRMIAGFEGVTSGTILIDGQEMQDTPPHLRPINMVFQNYAIFPHLNVRDNIAYGLQRLGTPRTEQARMVDEMLEMIALPGYGDRRAHQLSGGQMQRVALARALILKPKVLLLDEPLGALDKHLREQMQLELRSLQQRLGITFILVTHDQEEALALSDRIAVMADGEVVQVDSPTGLYRHPKNRLVAAFVGTMNFFDARIEHDGALGLADISGLGRRPLNGAAEGFPHGTRVLLAIRPEAMTILPDDPGPAAHAVSGRVLARQFLGGRELVHLSVEGRDAPVIVSVSASPGISPVPEVGGNPVWLSWHPDSMTLLSAD